MLMMRALFVEGCPADAHDARLFPSIDAKHGGMMPPIPVIGLRQLPLMLMMRALFVEGCPAVDAKHGGMMPADSCDWPQAAPG